jgi:putative DNA primase/helicase
MGKLTTCAGEPDQGKSVWACDTAARITRGAEWPDGSGHAPKGMVVLLSAEDDPEDTIVPRLMAAGADLSKVIILSSIVETKGSKRMFSLMRDLAQLRKVLEQFPDIVAIFIDPVNAYMGTSASVDTFKDADVRAVLGPVKELAEEFEIAGIIVTHFKKGGAGRAIDRVMGSTAFIALSRSGWAFVAEKDGDGNLTGRKLMALIKQNIAKPAPALAYRLVEAKVEGLSAPRMQWEETIQGTADELMEGPKPRSPKLDAAIAFLVEQIAEEPRKASEILKEAKSKGHSEKTLNRAKEELGAISYKPEGSNAWHWRLEDE